MKEQNNIVVEKYYEGDLIPSEIKKLRERYTMMIKHFTSYQYIDVVKRDDEVVALRIDGCIIYTHEGIFTRSYANTLLKIRIEGWDNNYLYVVVDNGLNLVKRLDISLPIRDDTLLHIYTWI